MNKCDGIKILELDPKRILEGNEYMVIAEKDQNFKVLLTRLLIQQLVMIDLRTTQILLQNLQQVISKMKLIKVYLNSLVR